ncbi:hypothetical protein AGMMS50229_21470 [Campylobacterota bacterium]|nr:hypothetical protein AGMMS50229_21470 [Campylobacterota bacterium]
MFGVARRGVATVMLMVCLSPMAFIDNDYNFNKAYCEKVSLLPQKYGESTQENAFLKCMCDKGHKQQCNELAKNKQQEQAK